MNPFVVLPTSPENFFPNITGEYLTVVQNEVLTRGEYSGYDSTAEIIKACTDPFDLEKPHYKTCLSSPVRPIKTGNAFSVSSFFYSADVSSLIKCVCRGDARAANAYASNTTCQCAEFVRVGVEESLRNKKYVLILCVFLPMRWSQADVCELNRLSLVSSELLSSQPDFEIVLVAKMRKNDTTGDDYDEDTFIQFLSTAFPGRLAVPYSSNEARDILCQKLGFNGKLNGVLVDNDKHHPYPRVLMAEVGSFVSTYSSIGFPLTFERLDCCDDKPPSHVSLAWLLRCDPSYRLENMASSRFMSIKQLNEKVLGLYLCQRGDKLKSLHEVYHQCRSKGLEFEIVFVCMPFLDCVNHYVFQYSIYALAIELELDISSWWLFPYHTSTCIRLWQWADIEHSFSDAMVILGPNSSYVDIYGGEIAYGFGVEAYPFTRDAAGHKYVDKAEEVTLRSLLNGESVDYLVEPSGRQVPLTYLCEKNVLLYVDYPPWSMNTCDMFREWYDIFKKRRGRSSFELVLVSNKEDIHPLMKSPPRGVTPLHYISDSKHSSFLLDHDAFFKGVCYDKVETGMTMPAISAFRKDGHINMLNALNDLVPHGLYEDPFDPRYCNIGNEVLLMMSEELECMSNLLRELEENEE